MALAGPQSPGQESPEMSLTALYPLALSALRMVTVQSALHCFSFWTVVR